MSLLKVNGLSGKYEWYDCDSCYRMCQGMHKRPCAFIISRGQALEEQAEGYIDELLGEKV